MIELRGVARDYPAGDGRFAALSDIDLIIQAGEFVAIQGPSGSGKSTLMNILGCLDRPTAGRYRVAGQDTARLNPNELAALRREYFGFIFQCYNLLPDLSALANVEVPAVYAGLSRQARHQRATGLLCRLSLGDRLDHRPTQLSGGEQQRVSIARALVNGGRVILADEPTGALDSHVGEEVLQVLKELHARGHTIILVTHDATVAAHAERIITLADGAIIADRQTAQTSADHRQRALSRGDPELRGRLGVASGEALRSALTAMRAHGLRTFLTMLGIIIGIASVAIVVALGLGGREKVLESIRALGTNTLDIYPGHGWGDEKAASIRTLLASDAAALGGQSYVEAVSPVVFSTASIRFGNVAVSGSVNGVGEDYFHVHPFNVLQGHTFSGEDVKDLTQVAVIDDRANERLFAGQDAIGRVILVGEMPARVIGVAKPASAMFAGSGTLNVWMPYTSVIGRLMGPTALRSITVRVRDEAPMDRAAAALTALLKLRHNTQDFFFFNTDTIRKSVESTAATMTLLVSSIAVISLVVGGIGVMNIMLVSVTERTREIGIRTAVGARRRDILRQFLLEAVLVCLIGGVLGVILALIIGLAYSHWSTPIPMIFSPFSIVASLVVSTLIGVTFGFLPARHAASLNSIDALARE
jgi:macrolide transport system ATP-binding/permease protein